MAENKYYGIYQGIVTNIKDPEQRARIKVKCPDVLGGSTESAWCDPMIPVAYDNGGDFCLPLLDESVWVQFIGGDVNKPVWLGGWWQKSMTPLGANYVDIDKIRIINYADCTITMKDGIIDINVGAGDYDLRIVDKKVFVQGDLSVTGNVTVDGNVSVKGNITTDSNITAIGDATAKNVSAIADVTALNVKAKTSVDTPKLTVNGVSFAQHTHKGVTSGDSNTGVPNA